MSFNIMLGEMRAETTKHAKEYINRSTELYNLFKDTKEEDMLALAESVAQKNNNEFGELFEAELPLVNWKSVKRSLKTL
jgi:hypothetical protein